jgi:hypothetical protein
LSTTINETRSWFWHSDWQVALGFGEGWHINTPLPPLHAIKRDVKRYAQGWSARWRIRTCPISRKRAARSEGNDLKIIADQQGYGLGVHLSDCVASSLASKPEAASALWSDSKALRQTAEIANRDK